MIKEIVASIKTADLKIPFRMDSGYFDEETIATIETLSCQYLIKSKAYPTLASHVTNASILFIKDEEGRKNTEPFTKVST